MTEARPEEPRAANLVGWRIGLQNEARNTRLPLAIHRIAGQLHESVDPYAVAASMKLPIPAYIRYDQPSEFLANPDAGLALLADQGIVNYYVGLRPLEPNLPKFRNEQPLALDGVTQYINQNVAPRDINRYSLRVAEFVVSHGGAVIVSNPSGSLSIDMLMGDHSELATGRKRPDYHAHADALRGILEYSAVDPEHNNPPLPEDHPVVDARLRSAIDRAVRCIPKVTDGFRGAREPGRYEMSVVVHNGRFVPVFIDAQPDYLQAAHAHPYALPEPVVYGGDGAPWISVPVRPMVP